MWPWGHAAVGYLLYTLWCRRRYRRPPAALATLALAVGTQFPDLVDKPLAWTFGLSPSGRAGAHSLLVAVPVVLIPWLVLDEGSRGRLVGPFAAGYGIHLGTDVLYPVFAGEFATLGFLLWPVTPLPPLSESSGIVAHFLAMELTSTLVLEVGLFGLATVAWLVDGWPGLALLGRLLTRPFRRDRPVIPKK